MSSYTISFIQKVPWISAQPLSFAFIQAAVMLGDRMACIQVTGTTEREFYLSFLSLFSNILCIRALSRKVVSTVRQTEHFSFFGQQSSCNMCCPQHNIFCSLRKPGFSQGEFSFSPCFHSPYPPQPQLHSSNEGKMKQLWFTIKCHRSPVRIQYSYYVQ